MQSIIPEKGTKIEHIVGQIMEQSEKLKLQEEMNEMYANPVTGPIPTKIWKGRRFWFADFEEEKSSRAAGGIKVWPLRLVAAMFPGGGLRNSDEQLTMFDRALCRRKSNYSVPGERMRAQLCYCYRINSNTKRRR